MIWEPLAPVEYEALKFELLRRISMSTTSSKHEEDIRSWLGARGLSPSHGLAHVDLVLSFAKELQFVYGGDIDVIAAAVLLHDLGRNMPQYQGAASALQSAKLAAAALNETDFPKEKILAVQTAIRQHDQPELRPEAVEGRILQGCGLPCGIWRSRRCSLSHVDS